MTTSSPLHTFTLAWAGKAVVEWQRLFLEPGSTGYCTRPSAHSALTWFSWAGLAPACPPWCVLLRRPPPSSAGPGWTCWSGWPRPGWGRARSLEREREVCRALSDMIAIIPGMATPRGEGSESSLGGRIFLVGNIGV